ncbi:hypothetical protein D9757_013755 [Collybiopsis confluens]|uniref:Uncharacterized protein n=1 Tax=Collybiopsis confluens TaxID=2823264 RepID=A0A8H5FX27_9AGAR|nr:hypothetical protein D9757_013755 [Collybiopsis confluens]
MRALTTEDWSGVHLVIGIQEYGRRAYANDGDGDDEDTGDRREGKVHNTVYYALCVCSSVHRLVVLPPCSNFLHIVPACFFIIEVVHHRFRHIPQAHSHRLSPVSTAPTCQIIVFVASSDDYAHLFLLSLFVLTCIQNQSSSISGAPHTPMDVDGTEANAASLALTVPFPFFATEK